MNDVVLLLYTFLHLRGAMWLFSSHIFPEMFGCGKIYCVFFYFFLITKFNSDKNCRTTTVELEIDLLQWFCERRQRVFPTKFHCGVFFCSTFSHLLLYLGGFFVLFLKVSVACKCFFFLWLIYADKNTFFSGVMLFCDRNFFWQTQIDSKNWCCGW
jgi:hypothetical protein